MLRLHGFVGHSAESRIRDALHALEHHGAIEQVFVDEVDIGRRRFRLTSDKGTDCAITLERTDELRDGAVLLLDSERAIVLRVGAPAMWRLRPRDPAAALQLGWTAGNLHWRVRFMGAELLVLLDGPLGDYRARLGPLFDAGMVEEIGDK